MSKDPLLTNPFEATKATDFSDREIWNYWVDLAGEGSLLSLINPTSRMPLYLLGGKGSGKTHLMRYCSFAIQKLRYPDGLLQGLRRDKYVGLYLHTDGLNTGRFSEKGQPEDVWRSVFAYFLELWIAEQALTAIEEILLHVDSREQAEKVIVEGIARLFDELPPEVPASIHGLASAVKNLRRELDVAVNNASMTKSLDIRIRVTPGRVIFGIPRVLMEAMPRFGHVQVLYLIDELENLSESQQKFINTLVRHRQGPCSIRVGSRLYGVATFETFSAGEWNREGAEYEAIYLDERLRKNPNYASFARRLCARRLKEHGFLREEEDVQRVSSQLDEAFVRPNEKDYWQKETLRLLERFDADERPYLRRLERALGEGVRIGSATGILDARDVKRVVEKMQLPEYPLLEKASILDLYECWHGGQDLKKAALRIERERLQLLENPKKDTHFRQLLNHFKSDLLAQLYRDCGERPVYTGLKSFIHMSAGIPRDLLVILKDMYSWASFHGEQPFQETKLSIASQLEAVRHAADWFFDDAVVPGLYAPAVTDAVTRLANLFRSIRFSDKPVECSLVTFSVNVTELSEEGRKVLRLAENWSYVIRIVEGQRDRNSRRIDEKYQLHPMLAPRWDLPIARRGALPLGAELANAIFDRRYSEAYGSLVKARVSAMNAPFIAKAKGHSLTLNFDE